MKSPLNQCERGPEVISLLASGALAGPDKAEIEDHLATCPSCRQRFAELTSVSAPLTDWERNFAHVEPGREARLHWAKAIQQTTGTRAPRGIAWKFSFNLLWRELVWPCRRTWAGLAAVWLTILVFNHSQADGHPAVRVNSPTPPGEMRLALREQRRVLDELIGPGPAASAVEPPRHPNNQPRSERRDPAIA